MFHSLDNSAKSSEAVQSASFQAVRDSPSCVDNKKLTSLLSPLTSLMLRPRSSRVTLDFLSIMEEPVTTIRILGVELRPYLPPPGPVRILVVELRPYLPPPGPLLELGAPVCNAEHEATTLIVGLPCSKKEAIGKAELDLSLKI